ncbi:MAG TPA: ATP-dependent RecD-like DNA helicase, partial [Desulfobacteraceae bacterium]|nr:ATP-dependent RecD-like DNA helicase [Desulfobacteraceae bacterium]
MLTELTGQIERITYSNEENGFTVVRLKTFGQKELVTVVGSFLAPVPGVILKMNGEWINHARYGEQFKVINYKTEVPATVYGIKKYLGSGLIKGIGPVMAGRIVAEFAENALDVIENNIQKLRGVEGIGEKRIAMIQVAWEEQKEIRSVMLFLQTHGVGIGYATRIFREYGDDSIKVVTENPYRLATDVFGIGFITADNIAEKLGFAKDAVVRIEAGIIYLLYQLSDAGHVYYPYESLVEKSMEILQVKRDIVTKAISTVAMEKRIVIEDINDGIENFIPNNKGVFLSKFYLCEIGIASNLRKLIFSAKGIR